MTLLVPSPVTTQQWRERAASRNGPAPQPVKASAAPTSTERWDAILGQINALQDLEDDWDGLGAVAPTHELVESAIGLAYVLKDAGADAPNAAIPGTDGSVNFVWNGPDGSYCEIEIDRPLHAEVMVLEPGKAPQFWVLPNT